jgi:2-oxoisovalerate ferredoxin oxidoreductase beta subunit
VHKYLAEAITELGVQDRTVAISSVGCSVFLYYYFDVGNTQAAHGRASAVALGQKLANPESIVVSYQGDGDLAAIGLAEIIHTAQMGLPITVIFVNNAIYGMTGGQMAPTTLPGQVTTTCPDGRRTFHGKPLKIAEMMAQLDGPVYVERVALYDIKTRKRAKRAIEKALSLQVEGRGFSLIEVLAECPTHLKMTGPEAEAWVRDAMLPYFPLGVYKDETREPQWAHRPPSFLPDTLIELIGASAEVPRSHGARFPFEIDPHDVAIKLAGSGGDGAQTAAMLLAKAAIREGFDATHIPSYGPESRGGTSYADVHVAREEVLSPASPSPHVLVAFNSPSLRAFGSAVLPGGTIVYDSTVVLDPVDLPANVKIVPVPCTEIAHTLGRVLVKNVVALGALQGATNLLPIEAFLAVLQAGLRGDESLRKLNEEAFRWGREAVLQGVA